MSATDLINAHPMFLLAAAFVVFGIGQYWWRYNRAKRTAEDWLRDHHYRVTRLRLPWFTGMVFGPSLLRDSDNAFVFEAVIDDTELGGTGIVWLRVWTTWLGTIDNDVEVAWKQMPDGTTGDFKPLADWRMSSSH